MFVILNLEWIPDKQKIMEWMISETFSVGACNLAQISANIEHSAVASLLLI